MMVQQRFDCSSQNGKFEHRCITKVRYMLVALLILELPCRSVTALPIDENASELIANATSLVERGMENDDDIDMFEEADRLATRAASLMPDNVEIQLGLADILFAVKEFDRAASTFELATTLDPTSFDAHFALGMTLAMQQKLNRAESFLRLATELDPAHADAHQALGSTLGNLNRIRESEAALLRAMHLDRDGDAEEQLHKVWKSGGRALPGSSGWEAARRFEMENIAAGSVRDSVQRLRTHEGEASWQKQSLLACASASVEMNITCGHKAVFYEAWEAAWRLVGKLARRPSGRHVVIGGGLGAVCLFSLHLGNASECHGIESLCLLAEEANDVLDLATESPKLSFGCGSLSTEKNLEALRAADIVWVIDWESSKSGHADIESHLASVLPDGAALVMFRMPHLSKENLQPLGVQPVELFCIGSVNDKCINYRPAVSWENEHNLTVFLLEVRKSSQAKSPQQCSAEDRACEQDLCNQPLGSEEERPSINISALPQGATAHWCGKHQILRINNFVSRDELSMIGPLLNAQSVNSSFHDVGRHPSECTHIWQRTAESNDEHKDANPIWENLLNRIDNIVGSQWGVVSINEARSEGSWGGCDAGLRNIHHDRNFYPQRFATIILYLTDVTEGGHTIFPLFPRPGFELTTEQLALREALKSHFLPAAISAFPPQQLILSFRHAKGFEAEKATIEKFCDEADNYFAIRPVAGSAVVFWHEVGDHFVWDGFHTGCPVKQGTKWTLQKFAERYQP